MSKFFKSAIIVLPLLLSLGCTVDNEAVGDDDEAPGAAPWNHDEDVSCASSEDCSSGETCEDGVCQMARCMDSYTSLAPMGDNHYFGTDGEYAVISDDAYIDAFEPSDNSYISSWDLAGMGAKVLDVAGGNLTGSRPQSVAVAIEYSDTLQVSTPDGIKTVNIGMWPKVIAAGDVDGDSTDELVAFAEDGTIAVCHLDEGTCSGATIDGVTGKDVAVADIDGDGFEEAIFLLDYNDKSEIIVWNLDAEQTGQEETYGWSFNFPIVAIGAGNISGAPTAEIVALEDGGWWGWTDDKIHLFSAVDEAFIGQANIDGHTMDVAVGDRNSDDQEEVAILTDSKKIELLAMTDGTTLSKIASTQITVGTEVQRLSMLDWNGDSASGRLIEGPELIAGDAVPVATMMFPPYPHKVAKGALNASITLGNTETMDESMSDTVSLSVGLGLSFGAEAFGFKAKVGGYFEKDFSYTERVTKTYTTGARYWILAQPDLHNTAYAPVILSCGCYHRYKYQLDDPSGLIGATGESVEIFVPVGGQTQLWSSMRYNAMARATGKLPEIYVPIKVGDKDSYPVAPETLDGQPIPGDDMLFPETPTYQISDVGFVSFWLQSGELVTNEVVESTKVGVKSSFGGGIVEVDSNIGVGVASGYSVTVGKSSLWAGSTPPVPDNPNTPEDEYALHRYSFQPFIYRQHYTDQYGDDAAYMVMHFAVGQ